MDDTVILKTYFIGDGPIDGNVAVLFDFSSVGPKTAFSTAEKTMNSVANTEGFPLLLIEGNENDYAGKDMYLKYWVYGPFNAVRKMAKRHKPFVKVCIGQETLMDLVAKIELVCNMDPPLTLADRMVVFSTRVDDYLRESKLIIPKGEVAVIIP